MFPGIASHTPLKMQIAAGYGISSNLKCELFLSVASERAYSVLYHITGITFLEHHSQLV